MRLESDIEKICVEMRKDIIRMTYSVGNIGAHIGGALSLVEIFAALYLFDDYMNKEYITSENRTRLILSKGHGVMAQYATMKQAGIIDDNMLMTFKKQGSELFAHPHMNSKIGIEFSSGSLGQGLSQGVGVALALKRKNNNAKVIVIVGDGECDEGSIWEAAMAASHFGLDNLYVIVDKNNIQYDGETTSVMDLGSIETKFEAFGWYSIKTDGHSIHEIKKALLCNSEKPKAIVALTIKGKGVSFMENNPKWHNGRLTTEQYEVALKEQAVYAGL